MKPSICGPASKANELDDMAWAAYSLGEQTKGVGPGWNFCEQRYDAREIFSVFVNSVAA